MRSYALSRLAAAISIGVISAACLLGQSATFVTNPSALTFDTSSGTASSQEVDVSLSTGAAAVFFSAVGTPGVTVQMLQSPGDLLPNRLRVSINPALFPAGTLPQVVLSGTGIQSKTIPIIVNSGATTSFAASPTSLSFVRNSTTTSPPATVSVLSNSGVIPTYTTSVSYDTGANWLAVNPTPGTPTTSPTVTITPVTGHLSTGTYTGTVILTANGFPTVFIPVTLSVDQGGVSSPLTVNPSSLAFTTAQTTQNVTVNSATPVDFAITSSANLAGIIQVPQHSSTPASFQVTVLNPSTVPAGTTGFLTLSPTVSSGYSITTVPITINAGGTTTFGASPTSLAFTQNSTTPPAPATVSVLSNTGVIPTYTTSISYATGSNWLAVTPVPGTATTSPTVTITPVTGHLSAGTYTGAVTLTANGFQPVTIPVTLSVAQTAGSQLTFNPSSLTFTPAQTTQNVVINSATPVDFAITPSSNLVGIVQVQTSATTPASFQVTVPNASLVAAGTTGFLTLSPTTSSGYSITTIPITINPAGTSTILVNPAALSFNGVVGSTTVPKQLISVTSSDGVSRNVQVTAVAGSNFLIIDNPFVFTPGTVSVGVNMAAITQPGTYFGTLSITPVTGGGATTFVQVTVTTTQSITVTPSPTSVTITGRTGGSVLQQDVVLNSASTNVPFTATATTTSGDSWLSVGTSNSTLPGTISIFANPANLPTGTYTGSVTVTAQNTIVATIPVTLTVTAAASLQVTPSSLVFNYETSSSSAPASQAIQVAANGANVPWTASVISSGNWLQITPTSGTTTPGTINVSVAPSGLAAGTYTGTVSVASNSASNSPQTVSVTLNVTTPALPLITSFQNAASLEQTLAVPGSIITIKGTDLGPATAVNGQINGSSLSTSVGDVEVLFDGIAAPIVYASATQINAIVPYELYGRTTTRLQIRYRNQRSRDLELRVQDTAPGLFTTSMSGTGQAAALNQNGTINSPNNPEQRGNVIVLYGTGHGQTTPGGTTGRIMTGTDLRRPLGAVTVRIGGQNAEVLYAGSAPGLVAGALQINARIPANSIIGPNVPVQVQVGNVSSQTNVTISVQ